MAQSNNTQEILNSKEHRFLRTRGQSDIAVILPKQGLKVLTVAESVLLVLALWLTESLTEHSNNHRICPILYMSSNNHLTCLKSYIKRNNSPNLSIILNECLVGHHRLSMDSLYMNYRETSSFFILGMYSFRIVLFKMCLFTYFCGKLNEVERI